MMAKDGRSGKLNRQDWAHFLSRVIPPGVWQAFGERMAATRRGDARWSAKYVVLCWVMMAWSTQSSLTERFRESREALVRLFPRRRRPGRSYQGLVKATIAAGDRIFAQFWACLRETIPQCVGRRWRWYGWVVMAVDGSRIDAARTRSNEQTLGIAGRPKTHPQWWITVISHLPTHLLWDWRQGPGTSDERSHLRGMLPTLPDSTLLVGDIGFCTFDLLWDLYRHPVDFLIRVGGHTTLLAKIGLDAIERVGGHQYVYLYPLRKRGLPPLRLRLIVLKRKGKRVYLLTSVSDSTRLSRSIASELYAARWGIEVGYRSLKQTLGRRKVLARTPQAGTQELAGSILGLGLLMVQAALAQGRDIVRVSVSRALRVVQRALEALRHKKPWRRFVQRLRMALRDEYRRRRSKRSRDWPHKKNDPPPGPPHLRRPTEREKALIDLFWNQIWAGYG